MKKVALLGFGLMVVSAAANAISINGSAGQDYTHLGFGMGTETSGLAMTGGWTHNDDDGDAASLGLGLNIPLGHSWRPSAVKVSTPTQMTVTKAMRRQWVAACSGKLATASACSASTTTLRIRSPAVSKL
jgi:hypothetical protein